MFGFGWLGLRAWYPNTQHPKALGPEPFPNFPISAKKNSSFFGELVDAHHFKESLPSRFGSREALTAFSELPQPLP